MRLGRDVLSRIIFGCGRREGGFGAAFVGSTLGALLGVISAYSAARSIYCSNGDGLIISFPLLILAAGGR